ncbi:patatin-domain-containing protein [Basidiobolus meristosporus CBS 931.73]|uniref:Patatin-domain-containing protein n=1 Tax=Basidiobolus meristosporus CBS 931.73 TaxID=1314790 RepID=A0A1Y1XDR8_9FUNG|nr:patatin-domain-containing protein [Basidiobolus meristosporus CBS 931.73]|eukprot:ORX83908.1 patatin-domain-containing protein [Basidiobolus meristosporus CBS 931.73]
MIYYLRSGLLRNLGGIHDRRLYRHSYVGTKRLIEEYISELVLELAIIANSDPSKLGVQAKMDFFNDTQQSFGRTALILQGGTTFGLYHLGVVKALHEQKLLPKILCGTGVGALIATLVCIHTDEELPDICKPGGINLQAFAKVKVEGNIRRKIDRLLKHGYLLDVKILEDCVRSNVGDITFEDAFKKTGRILNITVSPTRKYEVPQLLNYLTAPNVLIWSAACASTAMMGLYESVELLAKDKNGKIVSWNPSAIKWSEAALNESESHTTRLTELFHVNHFIVSQANPYIVPFISRGLKEPGGILTKIMRIIMTEARHRLIQLEQFNLLPRVFRGLIDIKLSGNVTIVPSLSISDFNTLFSNPTHNALDYWIRKGEASTWPMIPQIRNRCLVELELNKCKCAGFLGR